MASRDNDVAERLRWKWLELERMEATYIKGTEQPEQPPKEWFRDLLIDAYEEGITAARYILGEDFPDDEWLYSKYDDKLLEIAIDFDYGGNLNTYDQLQQYIDAGNTEEAIRLVETEWHRVFTTAEQDGAEAFQQENAKHPDVDETGGTPANGRNIVKVWQTMRDNLVRENHVELQGVTAPLDGVFFSPDGDEGKAPGGFELPENNVNCRCWLTFRYE